MYNIVFLAFRYVSKNQGTETREIPPTREEFKRLVASFPLGTCDFRKGIKNTFKCTTPSQNTEEFHMLIYSARQIIKTRFQWCPEICPPHLANNLDLITFATWVETSEIQMPTPPILAKEFPKLMTQNETLVKQNLVTRVNQLFTDEIARTIQYNIEGFNLNQFKHSVAKQMLAMNLTIEQVTKLTSILDIIYDGFPAKLEQLENQRKKNSYVEYANYKIKQSNEGLLAAFHDEKKKLSAVQFVAREYFTLTCDRFKRSAEASDDYLYSVLSHKQ